MGDYERLLLFVLFVGLVMVVQWRAGILRSTDQLSGGQRHLAAACGGAIVAAGVAMNGPWWLVPVAFVVGFLSAEMWAWFAIRSRDRRRERRGLPPLDTTA
jgi:hypothetical protein